jgi:hypothetical protein
MKNMIQTLEDVDIEEPVRGALRGLFERASAYAVNVGEAPAVAENPVEPSRIHDEISQRWSAQRALHEAANISP